MSESLDKYGDQKSNSITTAERLAELLDLDLSDTSGLSCNFVIAKEPADKPTTARAIPVAIFLAASSVRRKYLSQWTFSNGTAFLKGILDWNYYIERLSAVILKIVCIPAILQGLDSAVPEVVMPIWVKHLIANRTGPQQQHLTKYFQAAPSMFGKRKRVFAPLVKNVEGKTLLHDLKSLEEIGDTTTWLLERKKRWRKQLHTANRESRSTNMQCFLGQSR